MMLAYTSHKGLERTEKGEVQGVSVAAFVPPLKCRKTPHK